MFFRPGGGLARVHVLAMGDPCKEQLARERRAADGLVNLGECAVTAALAACGETSVHWSLGLVRGRSLPL